MDIKAFFGNPAFKITSGFLLLIIIGTILLSFPFMRTNTNEYSFVNILFTSVSSICVCGLSTLNIGEYFTISGQIVILVLMQIGGLGYMTIVVLLLTLAKKNLSVVEKRATQSSVGKFTMEKVKKFVLYIILITIGIEIIGSIFLTIGWYSKFGWKSLYYAIFHSVSAFCNGGITLFSNSLSGEIENNLVVLTIISLIILGGIGFIVLDNFFKYIAKKEPINYHTKIVIFVTLLLIFIPSILFFITEYHNNLTLGNLKILNKLIISIFSSVTTRTAGFNIIEVKNYANFNILVCVLLMIIGASPAGTGGGIKTTTFLVLLKNFFSMFFGKKEVNIFRRRIEDKNIERSCVLFFSTVFIITFFSLLLTLTEKNFNFIEIVFEICSAFGTAGLSMGITAKLTFLGKIIIMLVMFIGRVCILLIVSGLFIHCEGANLKYPEEKILIG
jgi:trk system potassium uptake protein TrkH